MDNVAGIQLLIRVVETGSFSKASFELGITRPTATKRIARLVHRLGARLSHRSTRGVTPTEIGALDDDKCRIMAHNLQDADSLAALQQSSVQGTPRIGTSAAFVRRVLTPLVLRFMQQHLGLQVDLGFKDRHVNLIEQGIDLAVRMGRLADSSLGARFLGLNPWVLVAARRYVATRSMPQAPADVGALEALIYSSVQGDEGWHFTGPVGQSVSVPVKGPLRSNNRSALLTAARAAAFSEPVEVRARIMPTPPVCSTARLSLVRTITPRSQPTILPATLAGSSAVAPPAAP